MIIKTNKLVLLMTIFIISCSSNEELSVDKYVKYVENKESGLLLSSETKGFKVTLQYKPQEYVVLQNIGKRFTDSVAFHQEMEKINGMKYFTMRIEGDIEPKDIDEEMNAYLNFNMQNKIKLIQDADTLDCKLYLYEQNAGIKSEHTFVFAFDDFQNTTSNSDNQIIIYEDSAFEMGTLNFIIKKEDLNRIPKLKIL